MTGTAPLTDRPPVFHWGRSFDSHEIEDTCPCPQEPCGLIEVGKADPDCPQHAPQAAKTSRQGHRADRCPGAPKADTAPLAAQQQLRDRIAQAVAATFTTEANYRVADAVLATVRPELDRLALLDAGVQEREALLTEARDLLEPHGGHGDEWPAIAPAISTLLAEVARLRAELATARADGMREGAATLRRHCPIHGYLDHVGMTCHCEAADQINAAVPAPSA